MSEVNSKHIALVSQDSSFIQVTRVALDSSENIKLNVIDKPIVELRGELNESNAAVGIIDINAARMDELEALQRVMRRLEGRMPVVVVLQDFDTAAVRMLMQMQVSDFLVKPVSTADLVRSCIRAIKSQQKQEAVEAQVYTFMPAAGGVGNTTIALETAFILHNSRERGLSTCVVDLNFQQGVCAEYLDLEPRFDITEVESQPERLDRQLLDVMLSKHESGLCVLAAPVQPTEMRSFNADVVVRMLDLVSAYFDNVVIDMPRTWFPWTETVLLGTNKLYVVTEMTVPCLRHTQRLISAISTQTNKQIKPNVIINRCEKRSFDNGLRQADVEAVLGENYAGGIPNNYRLVREAVDRGVPLHVVDPNASIIHELRKIILPGEVVAPAAKKTKFLDFGKSFLRKAG